jgi:hypothetical protein
MARISRENMLEKKKKKKNQEMKKKIHCGMRRNENH